MDNSCYKIVEVEKTGQEVHAGICMDYGGELAFFSKRDDYEEVSQWLNLAAERIQLPYRQVWFGLVEYNHGVTSRSYLTSLPQEFVYTRLDQNRTVAYIFSSDFTNWDWNQPQRPRDEHPNLAKVSVDSN